jgi:hypothetical protein
MGTLAKRLLFLSSVLPLLACATGGGEGDLLGAPEIRTVTAGSVTGGGDAMVAGSTTIRYEEQPVLLNETVPAGVAQVFDALLAAFRAEGLAPDGIDPATGIVSLSRTEWSGERNGRRLSDFLDCGLTATGQPVANGARVVVAVGGQVREAGAQSRVTLRLGASAYPYANLGEAVRGCVTTGEIERAILDRVQASLAPGLPPSGPANAAGAAPPPGPVPASAAQLPFNAGDRLRVWVSPSERLTGSFLGIRPDTLVLGTGRRTSIPLGVIQQIQVKRTRRWAILAGAMVGIAAGIGIATTTDLGIVGDHAVQGEVLNPGLGGLAGGLAGALVGSFALGSKWVEVPVGAVRPGSGAPSHPLR